MNAKTVSSDANPRLSGLVRLFFSIVLIIVVVGGGLYFVPGLIAPRWLWPLTPFNANFLGAVYLTELATVSLLVLYNRWAPVRVALPMSYVFTGVVTIVTFFYLDHFDFQRWATYFWFIIYIGSALAAAFAQWVYRRLPVAAPMTLPPGLRSYLLGQGVVQVVYGLSLLLVPSVASGFWPWSIDDFHGRVYSALFLTGGVGALLLVRSAAVLELRLIGVAQVASGLLPITGLIVVDASQHRVNWSAAGTWLWIAGFAMLFVAGVYMVWQSLVSRRDAVFGAVPAVSPGD